MKKISSSTIISLIFFGLWELLGRYIHAFGWINPNDDGYSLKKEVWDPYKERLFKRFRGRVGIIIDMNRLRVYYSDIGVSWDKVCGINQISTIIFLKSIPPQALIARDRLLDESNNIITPGKPYNFEELFELKFDRIF